MKIRGIYLVGFSILVLISLLVMGSLSINDAVIVSLLTYTFLSFVNSIGYKISFFEFLCFYSVVDTLLMPLVGYHIFNAQNQLARLWGTYMRVPDEVYYAYMIPANLALIVSTNIFMGENNKTKIESILVRIKDNPQNFTIGITLTIVGFLVSVVQSIVPASLSFVFYLLAMLKYVGPIYIYYSDYKYNKIVLWASVIIFFIQAIVQGLFGEFAMYVLLIFIVVAVRFRLRFSSKLIFLVSALFLVMVLQSIKLTYRNITWSGKTINNLNTATSSKTEIFATLFIDRLQNVESIFEEQVLFLIYNRINQGFLISRVMNYVPNVEPYAGGSTIARSLASIFVPRFLWPDKPEAGGRDNLARFVGIKRRLVYSMNIGPYGEAYGNFGPVYGVGFIFLYGALLAFLLKAMLRAAVKTPSVLLWLPLLFYYTLTMETDILTTINSFLKGLVFVLILYFIGKRLFKVNL